MVVWRPQALADREQIMDYIARDNPSAAIALDELIERKSRGLDKRPQIYRVGRQRGTREMVVHPNYLIIYRVRKDLIEILRVKHAAQKWP